MGIVSTFGIISVAKASIGVAEAFYELAHLGDIQKIEKLLHKGYSLESEGDDGLNPVCLAVSKQDKKAYDILISYGAKKKPECLKDIPTQSYRRFFGTNPITPVQKTYVSDTPYNAGTVLLGTAAVATAIALKGSTGGGGGGSDSPVGPGGEEEEDDDDPTKPGGDEPEDDVKCPENSTYNNVTKACECNKGYEHFGDKSKCYLKIEECTNQVKGECKKCSDGYIIYKGKCVIPSNCPENSVFNPGTNACDCNLGFGHYGSERECFASILYCETQVGNECEKCATNYLEFDNICYKKIQNCKNQNKDKCIECIDGYDTYGADETVCYKSIVKCKNQSEDRCLECETGYGTHGNPSECYEDVENCTTYYPENWSMCMVCNAGYIVSADGSCYDEEFCKAYPNSVPLNNNCVCDASKGYTGTPEEGCTQAEEGEYQEGDGNRDQWSNLNDKYCNSQGIYQEATKTCICYAGYAGVDCSSCSQEQVDGKNKYIAFDGRCYLNLNCSEEMANSVQSYNACVCKEDFLMVGNKCIAKIECGKGKEQVGTSEDPEVACQCKENFVKDEETGECLCIEVEGELMYDAVADACVKVTQDCKEENADGEKWTGENCDVCPPEYAIDENGKCGFMCAPNRKPIIENPECLDCADGYVYNKLAGTCIVSECEDGVGGYIKVDGQCLCNEKEGYAMSLSGICELKTESLIGIKDTNINNSKIVLDNNNEHRDIYGMKPVLGVDEEGVNIYYDSVYNALNYDGAEINITNKNTGNISIYGIYSPSNLYNSATTSDTEDTASKGSIVIKDELSSASIYGMKSEGINNIYNAFSYNTNATGSNNSSEASINITKEENSSGQIVGISGYNNIYNAYSGTSGGLSANSYATGNIKIENKGIGTVIGIVNTSVSGKINNAYAYLDSVVSDSVATGSINVEGRSGVYGMIGSAGMINSETQFLKKYNLINNFGATGTINVTGHSALSGEGAYGMYSQENSMNKADIYNAMGYNSKGIINVTNTEGGTAYGIYSENEKYAERDENGVIIKDEDDAVVYIYNNIYNAFRSSKVYGGDNVAAKGEINLFIKGGNENNNSAVGIYAKGDVFNSYINSGSDVKLEAIGEIAVLDESSSNSMVIQGINAGGDTIANAYSEGSNQNTSSSSEGKIHIVKKGLGNSSSISGIHNDMANYSKGVSIYNAALKNDRSTVKGTIKIDVTGAPNKIYGMYAERGSLDGQIKTIYNAYYENNTIYDENAIKGNVEGIIEVSSGAPSGGYAEAYGIYADESVAYNVYASVPSDSQMSANVTGSIKVKSYGGGQGGIVVGMHGNGRNSVLYNSTINSSIDVEALNNGTTYYLDAYGMKQKLGYSKNEGSISVKVKQKSNKTSNLFGMFTEDGVAVNDKTGTITIEGNNNNFGMYAHLLKNSSESVKLYNYGTINVSGGQNNYGMYAKIESYDPEKDNILGSIEVENTGTINIKGEGVGIYASGEKVSVKNSGTINITTEGNAGDNNCSGDDCLLNGAIKLENGATFINNADVDVEGGVDLDSFGGKVVLASSGSFTATEEIKGNLYVDTSTVTNTFDTKTVISEAISAKDVKNLELNSKSYMYNALIVENSKDSYDVEMKLKDFDTITSKDMAEYYKENYDKGLNSALFNALKEANSKVEFDKTNSNVTGNYVLPNMTEENLKISRSLDSTLLNELFNKDDEKVRQFVGVDNLFVGRDTVSSLTGYELDAQSLYTLYDKKIDNNYRVGLGLSFTNSDTDYDNDSTRKNFSVAGYIPLTYKISDNVTLGSIARLGYDDGEYTRYGHNKKKYTANQNAISYGLLNELRYKYNVNNFSISPFVGLNAIGWYYDSFDEKGDDFALELASSNVLSVESALGVYFDYDKELNSNSKLTTSLGLAYYHEFANPYEQQEAKIADTIGSYKLRNKAIDTRDRGVISAKINYDYKNISVYGGFMQYLEKEYPFSLDLGLKYNF